MQPKVSIIILNWNGLEDTIECLESLRKNNYTNYEVIVVDNNSTGNDVKIITEKYGDYLQTIIVNNHNLGFSGGNNVGIRAAIDENADVVLLLNNDTVVESDFLTRLVELSKSHPEAGILTPLINYYSKRKIVWFAGGHISKIRSSGFPDGIGKPEYLYTKNRFCTFASGCCMFIKKEVLEKIGLLDEKYFLYLEDSDFSYRAINEGYKILYVASSKIYHKVSSTTFRTNSLLALYYSTRNRFYFVQKHYGWYFPVLTILLMIIFPFKLIFMTRRKEVVKILIGAFNDIRLRKMGKSELFD